MRQRIRRKNTFVCTAYKILVQNNSFKIQGQLYGCKWKTGNKDAKKG